MRNRIRGWTTAGAAMVAVLAGTTYAPALPATPGGTDAEAAVREALQLYLDGHAAGRGDIMAPIFAEDARLSVVQRGGLVVRDAADYLTTFPGSPAADEAERRRWIESVDVVGDLALARVVLMYPGVRIIDYMTMHRVDGDWLIVHKAYQPEPR